MTLLIGRRGFLGGLLAAVVAPAIVRAESLMPVKPVELYDIFLDGVSHIPEHLSNFELDNFLLDRLKMDADRKGLQIRRPQFMTYHTKFNLHRRCTVSVVA